MLEFLNRMEDVDGLPKYSYNFITVIYEYYVYIMYVCVCMCTQYAVKHIVMDQIFV